MTYWPGVAVIGCTRMRELRSVTIHRKQPAIASVGGKLLHVTSGEQQAIIGRPPEPSISNVEVITCVARLSRIDDDEVVACLPASTPPSTSGPGENVSERYSGLLEQRFRQESLPLPARSR